LKDLSEGATRCGQTQGRGAAGAVADRQFTAQLSTEVAGDLNNRGFNEYLKAPDVEAIDNVHEVDHVGGIRSNHQGIDGFICLDAHLNHLVFTACRSYC
jgi:hypothetical protein